VNQGALLKRFDCAPIRGERSNYLIILQAAQDWIAPERISLELVTLIHVGEQILFGFCQFEGCCWLSFSASVRYQLSSRSSESTIALDLRTPNRERLTRPDSQATFFVFRGSGQELSESRTQTVFTGRCYCGMHNLKS